MKDLQSNNRNIKDNEDNNPDHQRQSDNGNNLGESLKSLDL